MEQMGILTLLIALPLVGACIMAVLVSGRDETTSIRNAKQIALFVSLCVFALSVQLTVGFDVDQSGYQFVEKIEWIEGSNLYYYLGVDGISLCMILLTTLLLPICILASWSAITTRVRDYMIAFLVLESCIIGVFSALDGLLFYVFFEAVLLPMFLIIGIWGGGQRIYASYKFFLYTLLGSVLFLGALLFMYQQFGTLELPLLAERAPTLALSVQQWLWLGMFLSFAVKMPMWPVHTWLPDAHVQAPTAGSVILAGVLLKMGGYGFIRFSLPMLPDASLYFAPFVYVLSIVALVYTSYVALVQEDMKKLIAYSSVAHMGYVTLGLFSFNEHGVQGAIMQMVSHGLVSAALFLCVGAVYDRLHTREIKRYGGVAHVMPKYAFVFMFFTMASVGLPATSGFIGEFLVILGAYKVHAWLGFGAATGMVLGAAYALWLYKRVVFGELLKSDVKKLTDLEKREMISFVPLVLLVLLLGIYPSVITDVLKPAVSALMAASV